MINIDPHAETAGWLLSASAVRTQSHLVLAAAERDELQHFQYDESRLDHAARYVVDTIRDNYPTLEIPYHARWRHFVVDGVDRWAISAAAACNDPLERARKRIDLAVVSVLLDAGAGNRWRYRDPAGAGELARSEGLAIASLDAFMAGVFSADPGQPARADANALVALDETTLVKAFQADGDNSLSGIAGRTALLNRLGHAANDNPAYFSATTPRIGNLADYFLSVAQDGKLPAALLLITLMEAFGGIWPGRLEMAGRNLGDTWRLQAARRNKPYLIRRLWGRD